MRSINTSIVALLPVASLLFVGTYVFGGLALRDFALALFVGLLTGAYSSIFVATPILAWLKEREPRYRALRERAAADLARGERVARVGAGRRRGHDGRSCARRPRDGWHRDRWARRARLAKGRRVRHRGVAAGPHRLASCAGCAHASTGYGATSASSSTRGAANPRAVSSDARSVDRRPTRRERSPGHGSGTPSPPVDLTGT